MQLLLIDPVTTARSLPVGTRRSLRRGIGYPGLGLVTIAALTPREVDVRIIDEAVEEIDPAVTPDLVGITVQAPAAPRAYFLADEYRSKGIRVVLGGIHTSLNPDEAAIHADAVVIGEAERTWPRLVDDVMNDRLQPLYRANGFANLDATPRLRRELLRLGDYRLPYVVQSSKGCPWGCEFCALHTYLGRVVRFRSPEMVVEEIAQIPGREILFADDNIYADRGHAARLMEGLLPLRKRWVAESTWHISFDHGILELAARSGCAGLFVGFDSINQQPVPMRKVPAEAARIYREAIKNIRHAGIPLVAAFVFGLDADDATVFDRSLEVVMEGGADLVNFSTLVPYPGTPVYQRLTREERILDHDWSHYISPNVCYRPLQMQPQDLHDGVVRTQRRFYSLRGIARRSVNAVRHFGWGTALLSVALNIAQKRNWGRGSPQ